MTDGPRFQPLQGRPDDAHRSYYGGRIVDLVLGVVDRRALQRPTGRAPRVRVVETGVLITLVLLLVILLFERSDTILQPSFAGAEMSTAATPAWTMTLHDELGEDRRPARASSSYAPYTP